MKVRKIKKVINKIDKEEGDNMNAGSNDPLHGIKLKDMLSDIIALFGYAKLHEMTEIRSFGVEFPYEKPVLKFIRKTPWARERVERIYINNMEEIAAMKAKKAKGKLKK